MRTTLAPSMSGSARSISWNCASRAGAAPVTPTTAARGTAERLLRVAPGERRLVVEARVGREEQVGDRRRAALARRRAHARVAQRDGGADGGEGGVPALADGLRRGDLPALGVLGQAARVALDDGGVGGQREAEGAGGQRLRVGGAAALGGEIVERGGRRVAQARQRDGRGDGDRDPGERDDVAQGDDDGGIAARHQPPPRWARRRGVHGPSPAAVPPRPAAGGQTSA